MLIETISQFLEPISPTNITTASVTEPTAMTAAPTSGTNGGVFAMGDGGQMTCSGVKLIFFGVGSDTNTFTAYLYGWQTQRFTLQNNVNLHVPMLLATFTGITLDSAQPVPAGTDLSGAANYFATAITLGVGNSGISVEVVSPGHASHEIAHVILDAKGCKWLECRFATGSSATSCNALVGKI